LGLLGYFYYVLYVAAIAGPVAAQTVEIHSEFQRINPFGEIVAADRSEHPREILSPEIPRNAHSVFHVSVTAPANTTYFLYVGSNPGNIIETTVYKEEFVRAGDEWIPDTLEPVKLPAFGYIPDFAAGIPGQTTRCYLLDIWVPPQADVRRVRVEVLLKIGIWYVAPMEVRIGEARVPRHDTTPHFSIRDQDDWPGVGESIDLGAMDCLARYLLGWPQTWNGGTANIRSVIRRGAEQDMAIARQHPKPPQFLWFLAEDGMLERVMSGTGAHWSGAEWYLRVRDWIYRNTKFH
jgi:hypothetical protein